MKLGTTLIKANLCAALAAMGAASCADASPRPEAEGAVAEAASALNWVERQKLVAGDASAMSRFGHSVAIDGDTAVVGAIFDDEKGDDAGAAYVFVRSGGQWAEEQKLLASDA